MNCRRAQRLLSTSGPSSRALREHLETCESCESYRDDFDTISRSLAEHHTAVAPPAGFAARVRSRLRRDDDPIGWAALRLLPATLGLVLLLSWLNLRTLEPASDEMADPTTAVLSWVLEPSAEPSVEAAGEEPALGEDS